MKLFTYLVLTLLLYGSMIVVRFNSIEEVSKTSFNAPDSIENNGIVPKKSTTERNRQDAVSNLRQAQAIADIRAREQRYLLFGKGQPGNNQDLQSAVRSNLEINLPTASLAVQAKSGLVIVAGTVQEPQHLEEIAKLAQEIRGVIQVKVKAIAVEW